MTSSERPRVTVVMTAYNQVAFIPAAVESVLAQDDPSGILGEVEVLIVDDGSTEDVPAAVAPYSDRVRYIRRKNGGLAQARNTGIEHARGEYVAFCDSDDIHLPYRLAAHATLLDQSPNAALVFSDLQTWQDGEVTVESTLRERKLGPTTRTFDEELNAAFVDPPTTARSRSVPVPDELGERLVYQGHVPQLIATYHIAWGGAAMYRRDALVAVEGHDPALRRWPDWGLASKLSKVYELIYLDVPALLYRQHGAQLTKQNDVGAICYHHVAYTVWKDDPVFSSQHPDIRDRVVHAAAMRLAGVHVRNRDWSAAEPLLRDAMRARPFDRRAYTAFLRSSVMRRFDAWRKQPT